MIKLIILSCISPHCCRICTPLPCTWCEPSWQNGERGNLIAFQLRATDDNRAGAKNDYWQLTGQDCLPTEEAKHWLLAKAALLQRLARRAPLLTSFTIHGLSDKAIGRVTPCWAITLSLLYAMRASLMNSFTIPVGPKCEISDFLGAPYTISIKNLLHQNFF